MTIVLMMVIEFLPRVDAERIPRFCQCQSAPPWPSGALDPASDGRFPNTDPDAGVLWAICNQIACIVRRKKRCICESCRTTSSSAWNGSPLVTRLR
jgi:hypothetical protein